jgi:predicted PurR-regulated permease PerM
MARATRPRLQHPEPERPTRPWRLGARAVCAIALVLFAVWMISAYLVVLAWALVIALTAWPLYERLVAQMPKRLRDGFVPPLLFTMLTGIVLLIPLTFAVAEVGIDLQQAAGTANDLLQNGVPAPAWLDRIPFIGSTLAEWWQSHLGDPEQSRQLLSQIDVNGLKGWLGIVGAQVVSRLSVFLLVLITLFFLFRGGAAIGLEAERLVERWLGDPGGRLVRRLSVVVRGTVNGTVLVALGEGGLIGGAYFVAGVPHAAFLGALTSLFALLPLGAWFVFGVVAAAVIAAGKVLAGLAIFVFGGVVMLIGDTIVQPSLVGNAARMPFPIVLFGILGGLEQLGLIGLFVGPVVMAALLFLWRELTNPDEQAEEDEATA